MKKCIALMLVIIVLLAGCRAPATTITGSTTAAATSSATSTAVSTTVSPTVTSTATTTTTTATVSPDFQLRLDRLVTELEQQMQTYNVPGMAIAVVKDDTVVFTHGFGMADLTEGTPVTPETVFAIGSSTKAFTSTLVGMMVDEGKMDWDAPVTDYLPYFQMDILSDNESDVMTIRDVLSHRTGFPRMGLLFASGKIPREEVLADATKAEPYAPFREKFYYSNVMYMSAGVAAGKVADSDWDTLVQERILTPLGMTSTTTSVTRAEEDSRLALGYLWDEDLQDYEYKPMRNVDNIGPAGAINSNVLDMSQWLRFQLGRGEYVGTRLISESNLEETWQAQTHIAEGIDYGMGWMIREWEGQRVIEHGGNVDGFSAEVALLPDADMGFVLLTNASVSSLPSVAINLVWDTLLGEAPADGSPAADYAPYTGNYIANFGQFQDTVFEVLVQNGRLAVDIPGQMVYELKDPDAAGKWYFTVSDAIAVSFERDEEGNVTGMKMYQSGLTFELPREGYELAPEIPLEELQMYLGSYRSDELGITATVLIQNNRLAVDVPGQMVYELYPPDADGKWVFRVTSEISVSFNEDSTGEIVSLTMYQAGMEFVMVRTESFSLPTVDDIMALRDASGNAAALAAMGNYRVDSTIYSVNSGVRGTVTTCVAGPGKYRVDADYGKYGYSRTVVNGDHAWVESSFGPFEELHGVLLAQAQLSHPDVMTGDWRDYYDTIKVLRADTYDGKDVYVMSLQTGELPAMTVYVDAATGDVLLSQVTALQEGGIGIPVTVRSENFREVHGIRMPERSISTNEQSGKTIVEDETVETNLQFDDDFFILMPPLE